MSVHYHQFSCVGFANSHASCSLERCTSNYQSRARQEVSGTGVGTCKFMEKQPFHPLLYHLKREIPVRCCLIPYLFSHKKKHFSHCSEPSSGLRCSGERRSSDECDFSSCHPCSFPQGEAPKLEFIPNPDAVHVQHLVMTY